MRLPVGRTFSISAIFSKVPGFVSPRLLAGTSDIYIYIYSFFCVIIGEEHKICHVTYFPQAQVFLNEVQ